MTMDITSINEYALINLNKINIVLGKNGCGKSTLLRRMEEVLASHAAQGHRFGKIKYITPERGGVLTYEAGTEQNITANINWLPSDRRKNQSMQFRQQSVAQYRKLKDLVLEEIEKDKRGELSYTFDIYVKKINSLLDNIEIKRHDTTFKIYRKGTVDELRADAISSGESELISLGIECLIFSKECVHDKENMLFLDEPDVHLHPDLQVRLMHFLKDIVTENKFSILIATHSTAILGALESYTDTHLAFMSFDQKKIEFKLISEVYKKILPVFGAHPLSNVFNEAPILLVEGEDDERIWQQTVRSSNGKIKVYPCSVDGVDNMNRFEQETQEIIQTVYDGAKAYSLRDRDGKDEEIDDLLPVTRIKLACRNAENLLLTNEVLNTLGTDWSQLQQKINKWLENSPDHSHYKIMGEFKDNGFDRKNYDIKEIRNDLIGIIGSSKPWEVAVGQTIAKLTWNESIQFNQEGSIYCFLGEKVIKNIIPKENKRDIPPILLKPI